MKIDGSQLPIDPTSAQAASNTTARSASASGGNSKVGEARVNDALGNDQAQLSASLTKVQDLAAKAGSFPEIRQAKVQALSHNIRSGTYSVSTEQTAEALISHLQIRPAA